MQRLFAALERLKNMSNKKDRVVRAETLHFAQSDKAKR